jgi:putative hydrolase of the HAD superfamily
MIKNLLFDFGDVFIDLDKGATLNALLAAGYSDIPLELYPLIAQYEKGLIPTETFVRKAGEFFPGLSQEELISAWNGIVLDFPEYRLKFIQSLAKKGEYRLFLLSNTNELHLDKVKERMGLMRYETFKACFEGFYLSHKIALRKPERAVFEMILENHDLKPVETLFIDDTFEHIESAGRLGLKTWHLKAGQEDVVELNKHLKDA